MPDPPLRMTLHRLRDDLVLEEQRSGPMELPTHDHSTLMVTVSLAPRTVVERFDGGRNTRAEIRWGSICVLPPGLDRRVVWHEEVEALHLHLDGASSGPEPGFRDRLHFHDPLVRELIMRVWRVARRSPDPLFLDAIVQTLLGHLGGSPEEADATLLPTPEELMFRLRDFVREHPAGGLRVTDLARAIDVSEQELRRLTRASTGLTPWAFVTRVRVELAADLIRHGDLTLSQVALPAGFYDQSHLTRWVRRHFGTTPAGLSG